MVKKKLISFIRSNIHLVKNLLHIIRWPNLLLIAGIQVLVYFRLMDPELSNLTPLLFAGLSLVTILLGAGGYVINDYYDQEIDRINKPHRVIAGHLWTLSKVKTLYGIVIFSGAILSLWLSWELSLMQYLFIYPIAVLGLWYYSFALKCKPVIGNLWVSLFCAGVVAIIALPDILLQNAHHIKSELWYYAVFAFLSTWYREVVKDIEDKEGDAQSGCRTFVVKYGIFASRIMAVVLGLFLVGSLLYWDTKQLNSLIKLGLNILQGFTVASMALVWWAKNTTYYHYASNVIKLVMLGGTILLLFA